MAIVAASVFVALLPLGIGLVLALRHEQGVEESAQHGRQRLGGLRHGR